MVWENLLSSTKQDWSVVLTHPDLSEAALSQFKVEAQGLSGNLPGIPGQSLGLRFGHRTHIWQSVAQPIRVLWNRERAG